MIQAYRRQYGDFISLMPQEELNDNYHPKNSHVLAALEKNLLMLILKN